MKTPVLSGTVRTLCGGTIGLMAVLAAALLTHPPRAYANGDCGGSGCQDGRLGDGSPNCVGDGGTSGDCLSVCVNGNWESNSGSNKVECSGGGGS